jgi:hypothetical protein
MLKLYSMSQQETKDAPKHGRRNATAVVGIEQFAVRKGVVRGLQSFHKRKEKKRVETAKALKEYKKVMVREGYEPGAGKSRKRKHAEQQEETDRGQSSNPNKNDANVVDGTNKRQRKPKSNPLVQMNKKMQEQKDQSEAAREAQKLRKKERFQHLAQRKERTKLLNQRTKKGQPIMKNMVQDILAKLEKK